MPVPTITAALFARYQSEMKTERVQVASVITTTPSTNTISVDQLLAAYQLSRIINHHQGFKLIRVASEIHKWNVPMAMLAVIWTNGCIIRSKLMEQIAGAFATDPKNHCYNTRKLVK